MLGGRFPKAPLNESTNQMKGIVWVHSPRRWHQCTSSALPNSPALGQLPALSPTARPHCRAVMEIRPKPWLRWTHAQGEQWGLACSVLTITRTSELFQAPPMCLSGITGNNPYYNVLSTVCTDLAVYFLLTPHLHPQCFTQFQAHAGSQ